MKSKTNVSHSKEEKPMQKVVDEVVYYFNYIKPVRKLKRKPPV